MRIDRDVLTKTPTKFAKQTLSFVRHTERNFRFFLNNSSNFVFVEKHVWYSIGDGKLATGLGADEVAVDDLDFQEDMMGFPQKVHVCLVIVDQGVRQVSQLAQPFGSPDHLGPVQLGYHTGNKVLVELDLAHSSVLGLKISCCPSFFSRINSFHLIAYLDSKWESNLHSLHSLGTEHVVCQKSHPEASSDG